jgi:hypothetical protein
MGAMPIEPGERMDRESWNPGLLKPSLLRRADDAVGDSMDVFMVTS